MGGLFGASGVTVRDVYFDTSVFPPVEDVGVSFGDAERAEVCEVAEGCEDVRRAGAFEERADGVRVETGCVNTCQMAEERKGVGRDTYWS